MTCSPTFVFSPEQQALLREKLFDLLWQKGVRMDHPTVLKVLADAGAKVDFDTKQVCFPKDLFEDLLSKIPKAVLLAANDPAFDLNIPTTGGQFYVRTGTGAPKFLSVEDGSYNSTQIADIATWAKVAGALENIDFCAFPSPADVPVKTADIHAIRAMFENSPKHIWVQPYSAESIEYLFKLTEIAAGGEEALRQRPLASFITCSLTPLDYKYMDLEIIVQACRRGVPLHACSLPSAGGTAPVTMAGTVLLATAEVLVMLAVAQAIQPGTPGIATPLIFSMDMLTGRSLQGSVEAIQGASAAVNFIKSSFNIPVHTYGFGADSPDIDGQAQSERSFLSLMVALAGSDILGGAGQVEVATTISPLQLIIDSDLAGMVQRLKAGMSISDETLAWSDLLNLHPGSHFLNNDHTLIHCRKSFKSRTFIRQSRETWVKKGQGDYMEKAKEIYHDIMAREQKCLVSEDAQKEMNALVQTADKLLCK